MAKKRLGDYTVVLIKPDGVKKGIVGNIIRRFERVGLKIAAAKMIWVDAEHVGKHYRNDDDYCMAVGKGTLKNYEKYGIDPKEDLGTKDPLKIGRKIRKWNMDSLSSGPVFALLLEGPGAVELIRKMVGALFPSDSPPGTIRGDFALDSFHTANIKRKGSAENVVHASGSKEEAEFERKLWFKESEIYKY